MLSPKHWHVGASGYMTLHAGDQRTYSSSLHVTPVLVFIHPPLLTALQKVSKAPLSSFELADVLTGHTGTTAVTDDEGAAHSASITAARLYVYVCVWQQ